MLERKASAANKAGEVLSFDSFEAGTPKRKRPVELGLLRKSARPKKGMTAAEKKEAKALNLSSEKEALNQLPTSDACDQPGPVGGGEGLQ